MRGDVNDDGSVGFDDLVTLARHYGQSNVWYEQGDLDFDGRVDFSDLALLARNYEETLTSAQLAEFAPAFRADVQRAFDEVPEPSATGFIFLAAGAALCRPHRRPVTTQPAAPR